MSDLPSGSRSRRLDRALAALLDATPEIEAAAVVSFDGLPMASALPAAMDEDRVAAMSAALLSLGERAAAGLGRGELSQVYIEGETGTVFLVSADNLAVLVAVARQGAKAGLMLYEVRRAAAAVAAALADDEPVVVPAQAGALATEPLLQSVPDPGPVADVVRSEVAPVQPVLSPRESEAEPASSVSAREPEVGPLPSYVSPLDPSWSPSYAPSTFGSTPSTWS